MKPGQLFIGLAIVAVAWAIYAAVAEAREKVKAAGEAVAKASTDLSHIIMPRDQDALGSPYNPLYWVSAGLDRGAELVGYLSSDAPTTDKALTAAKVAVVGMDVT